MKKDRDYYLYGWNKLSVLGNNRIVRSSYYWVIFVPIVAKFIEKLPNELSLKMTETTLNFTLALPFSWKVLYFSSLCFGLATLLFSRTCPDLVRKYPNYSDFKDSGLGVNQLNIYFRNWLRNAGEIRDATNDIVSQKEAVKEVYDKFSLQNQPHLLEMKTPWHIATHINFDSKLERDAFWYIQSMMYNDKIRFRIIIAILYLMGFLSILFLLLSNICYVFNG